MPKRPPNFASGLYHRETLEESNGNSYNGNSINNGNGEEWNAIHVEARSTNAKGSKGYRVCFRITLGFCTCGAAIGICLLIAGGIGRLHNKILMYVGILIFLVSIVLLVILCSSYGLGSTIQSSSAKDQNGNCTCKFPFRKKQKSIPVVKTGLDQSQHAALYAQQIDNHRRIIDESGSTIASGKRKCNVKNCVCQQQEVNNVGVFDTAVPLSMRRDSHPINMYEGCQLSSSTGSSPFVVSNGNPLQAFEQFSTPVSQQHSHQRGQLATVHQKTLPRQPPPLKPKMERPPPAPKIPLAYQPPSQVMSKSQTSISYRSKESQIYTEPQISYTSLPHKSPKSFEDVDCQYQASLPHKTSYQPSTPIEYRSTNFFRETCKPMIDEVNKFKTSDRPRTPTDYKTSSQRGSRALHTPSDYQVLVPYSTSHIPEPPSEPAPPLPHKSSKSSSQAKSSSHKSSSKSRQRSHKSSKHKTLPPTSHDRQKRSSTKHKTLPSEKKEPKQRPTSMPIPLSPSLPLQATRPLPVQIKPAQSMPLVDEYLQSIGQFTGEKSVSGDKMFYKNGLPYFDIQEVQMDDIPFINGNNGPP